MKKPMTPIAYITSTSVTRARERVDAERAEHEDARGTAASRGISSTFTHTPDQRQVQQPAASRCRRTARRSASTPARALASNSSGPGWRLKIWNAASMIAAVADVGMPSVSSGTSVAGEGRVVGRLGPGHALDRALAALLLGLPRASRLLGRVGQERRHLRAAGRQRPEREADRRRRAATASTSGRQSLARASGPRALDAASSSSSPRVRSSRRHVQRLADREQPDRHDHDVDPVAELVDAERQPRLPGQLVDPDEPDQQPDGQRREPADQRAPTSARSPTRTPAASARSSPRRGT